MVELTVNFIKKIFPKSDFARSATVLAGGTAGSQILLVIASPLLTRIYSPADFGLLAVFTAFLAFFTVISCGRYELAIPLPDSDQDAANLAAVAIVCVVLTTLLAFFIILIWSFRVASVLNTPKLSEYLWLVPFAVFFVGVFQVFSSWAIRVKRFPHIARTKIFQTLGTLLIQLGGCKFGVIALLGGHAAGMGVGASGLAVSALKRPQFKTCSFGGMRLQAERYRKFPIFSTWTALFNTIGIQLAPIIFVALYGATVAGLYALTLRILSLPISFIGNAIGNVFLSSGPQARRSGDLAMLVKKLHNKLAMVGAIPLAILLFFGPEIFAIVFGEEWRKAGRYAQWMAPWIYLQFQWSPLSTVSTVLELQRSGLIAQLLVFFVRFGVLYSCCLLEISSEVAIPIFAVASTVVYYLVMTWFFRKAEVNIKEVLWVDLKCVFLGLLTVLPLWAFLRVC